MQQELKNISYIFYIDNMNGKLHTCNIRDKEEVDANDYPRYLGQYGNCLIALRNQKITDKLYLMTEETFGKIKRKFWQIDRYILEDFLEKYSDRTVERQ